tara:strand:- start:3675 stop:7577 length:3903 start_codon:yes stop_codon:yes gene_type:complete
MKADGTMITKPVACEMENGSINKQANQNFCCTAAQAETTQLGESAWSGRPRADWPNDPRSTDFTSILKNIHLLHEKSQYYFGNDLAAWAKGTENACIRGDGEGRSKLATYQRLVHDFYSAMCNHDANTMKSRSTRGLLLFHSTGSGKSNSAVNAMMGMWGKTDPGDEKYKLIVFASNADTASVGLDTYIKDAAMSCPHPIMEHLRKVYVGDHSKLLNYAKVILLLSLPIAWDPNPNRTLDPIAYYTESEDQLSTGSIHELAGLPNLQNPQTLWGQMLSNIKTKPILSDYFMDEEGDSNDGDNKREEFLRGLRAGLVERKDLFFDMKKQEDVKELETIIHDVNSSHGYGIQSNVLRALASAKRYGRRVDRELKQFQLAGVDTLNKLDDIRKSWRMLSLREQMETISKWGATGDERSASFKKLEHIDPKALHISFDDLYSWISPLGFTNETESESKIPDQASLREYWTNDYPLDKNMLFLIVDEAHTIVQKSSDTNDGLVWNRLYAELNSRDDNPEYRCVSLRDNEDSEKLCSNGMILLLMTATPGDNPCEIVRLLSLLHSHRTRLSDIATEKPENDVPLYKISHEAFLEDDKTAGEIVYITNRDSSRLANRMALHKRLASIITNFDEADSVNATKHAEEFAATLAKDAHLSEPYKKKYASLSFEKQLNRYRKRTSTTTAANNVLLRAAQASALIASSDDSKALLSLHEHEVLSMKDIFSLLNGEKPGSRISTAIENHYVGNVDEYQKLLTILEFYQTTPHHKLAKAVDKGELDHFFISGQTTLKYDEKHTSQIQYFVHTDTRTTLKSGGELFGAFCQGLVSYVDATTDRTKFVKYCNNHEISSVRNTPDPFHVQVTLTPPMTSRKTGHEDSRHYILDLIDACDRGEQKAFRKGSALGKKYKKYKKTIQEEKITDRSTLRKWVRRSQIKFMTEDFDDFDSHDLPLLGRTRLKNMKNITSKDLSSYSKKVHALWKFLVGDPILGERNGVSAGLSQLTDNCSLSFKDARHFVHFPYVLEQADCEFLVHLIDSTIAQEGDTPPLKCWLPEKNYNPDEALPLPEGCRWVSLMLTVKDGMSVPADITEFQNNMEPVEFYSRMSLAAFNNGSISPWKLPTVDCSKVTPHNLHKWAALVTDGQKHKAFNICYGQFTHLVSPPHTLSAAQQAKGRLTRYCSHGAVKQEEWNAALVVYFNVEKYMFLSKKYDWEQSHGKVPHDKVFEMKQQLQLLEAERKQDKALQYKVYYDALAPNAQRQMHTILQRAAIDCPIFSPLHGDPGHCWDYEPTPPGDESKEPEGPEDNDGHL